jgi:hypothetical protein
MNEPDPTTLYLTRVESRIAADPRLTTLASGILAAADLGIAMDSLAFCRALDVSHALALREIGTLEDLGLLRIVRRDQRTGRTHYELPTADR